MTINSRDKGARGERELSTHFKEHGFEEARRGQQFAGSPDSPDVLGGPPGVHHECKRTEKISFTEWHRQVVRDAAGKPWAIWWKRNRGSWICMLDGHYAAELLKFAPFVSWRPTSD